jgi:hypothetical protein
MRKTFLLGVLAGCAFSALIFAGYHEVTKHVSKTPVATAQVQRQVIQKIRTEQLVLSVQNTNGIYCSEDREQIQLHYDELNKELNRINGLPQKPAAYAVRINQQGV